MTELTWVGKYNDAKKVGPVHIQIPFETVETVNETAQQRQFALNHCFADQNSSGLSGIRRKKFVL